jgi:hypothetical protein
VRTRIYIDPAKTGDDDPFIDVNHDEPLSEESIAAFRDVGKSAIEHGWPEPAPLPPDYWETAE